MKTSGTTPTRKRKTVATATPSQAKTPLIDLTGETSDESETPRKRMKHESPVKITATEKRLRRFRTHAPTTYREKLHRATTQRMFVIDRSRHDTDNAPEEVVEMAGTTGNVYSVKINQIPSCTCPDNRKGNQCKHIVYVLHNVLKAPEHLQYQLALLSSELRDIFAAAPMPGSTKSPTDASSSSNRKEISGDCPICFMEFSPSTEEIVYCKAACGNNIHKTCFEQWAKSKSGESVRCVYCRTPWQADDESIKRICQDKGRLNSDGYVNVAAQLGISGARDYSTYHQPWLVQVQINLNPDDDSDFYAVKQHWGNQSYRLG